MDSRHIDDLAQPSDTDDNLQPLASSSAPVKELLPRKDLDVRPALDQPAPANQAPPGYGPLILQGPTSFHSSVIVFRDGTAPPPTMRGIPCRELVPAQTEPTLFLLPEGPGPISPREKAESYSRQVWYSHPALRHYIKNDQDKVVDLVKLGLLIPADLGPSAGFDFDTDGEEDDTTSAVRKVSLGTKIKGIFKPGTWRRTSDATAITQRPVSALEVSRRPKVSREFTNDPSGSANCAGGRLAMLDRPRPGTSMSGDIAASPDFGAETPVFIISPSLGGSVQPGAQIHTSYSGSANIPLPDNIPAPPVYAEALDFGNDAFLIDELGHQFRHAAPRVSTMELIRSWLLEDANARQEGRMPKIPRPKIKAYHTAGYASFLITCKFMGVSRECPRLGRLV